MLLFYWNLIIYSCTSMEITVCHYSTFISSSTCSHIYKYSKHNFLLKLYRTRDRQRDDVEVRIIARCIASAGVNRDLSFLPKSHSSAAWVFPLCILSNERIMNNEGNAWLIKKVLCECCQRWARTFSDLLFKCFLSFWNQQKITHD